MIEVEEMEIAEDCKEELCFEDDPKKGLQKVNFVSPKIDLVHSYTFNEQRSKLDRQAPFCFTPVSIYHIALHARQSGQRRADKEPLHRI
ncbi:hypothetical protein TYRP_016103 [Tyrophagus putrescentiae]|nr:hypothetical protein TYRP_016103 [Tyrophagus putrescentiae]